MDALQKGILTLVRSALTGQALDLLVDFRMEDAAKELKRHQLVNLGFEGAVLCGVSKTEPTMQKLFATSYRLLLHSEKQLRALKKLCDAFEENGIDYMPVKGCNLKALYSRPELRAMGDADILIRLEQYEAVVPVMEQLGYQAIQESDHEFIWDSPALHVELHKRLVPSYHSDLSRYFSDGWQLARPQGGRRYGLRTEDEFLYLFIHYTKHYRDGGIGLRQPIDLWVWQKAYPDMDMALVRRELENMKLLEFFDNTMRMLRLWLEDGEPDDKILFMTDYIFLSGSWGLMENHLASTGVREEKQFGSRAESRRKDRMRMLFPSAQVLSRRYPVLKKAPWLLPAMWPVRWVSAALFRQENIRDYQKSLAGKTDEKLDRFESTLKYVGLEFDL